ncbi:MAG TPA: coagulation factor 5/8 type domain-containing protein [Candidatus Limnocylindrales bacterium]|nr:coagulation factor 5/8 type domain-containing protein [Candidatus Limnocylindrales bacterium]
MRLRSIRVLLVAGLLAVPASLTTTALTASSAPSSKPDFGSSVHIFSPSMDQATIQAELDAIAAAQVGNQFGPRRDAVLFQPGTYGSAQNPLNFQVGYYTSVAGLGQSPGDVVINGSAYVRNQCDAGGCTALVNFWRSLSNLTINVNTPGFGCYSGEFWPVSQASPMRRVQVNGLVTLMDYCTGPSFASGGFIADSAFSGSTVINGSQQQWFTRNSSLDGWTNGVWNQVFAGVAGAPATCFPCGNPYTTLPTSPITREAPYLYVDSEGAYRVFVPAVQRDSSGTTWGSGPTPGTSLPISSFFVARPDDSAAAINKALRKGKNLILTPGIYRLDRALEVSRAGTVVLGLGFPTLIPTDGNAAMKTTGAGVSINGILFDAGAERSPVLLQVGAGHENGDEGDESGPSALHDVFFRIGGAAIGKATTALIVNSDNTILDDIWAWRADHGNGVGWTSNTSNTGVIVNGDNVTAYGLFVEHFQKYEVIWNGDHGTDVFFQNEMPYDVPSQAAWSEAPGVDGFAAFKVGAEVESFQGYGMGSYSFFNQGIDIFAERAFEVPDSLPAGSLHDLLTIFLDKVHGKGGIRHVVNETGGSSTAANADQVVPVVSFP